MGDWGLQDEDLDGPLTLAESRHGGKIARAELAIERHADLVQRAEAYMARHGADAPAEHRDACEAVLRERDSLQVRLDKLYRDARVRTAHTPRFLTAVVDARIKHAKGVGRWVERVQAISGPALSVQDVEEQLGRHRSGEPYVQASPIYQAMVAEDRHAGRR